MLFRSPGFVDAHCHLGMFGEALGFEGDDGNESTDPCTPHLRAIDAINPLDRCFEEAREAGVTTVVTGPGSANPISGQLEAIKTAGRWVDAMVANDGTHTNRQVFWEMYYFCHTYNLVPKVYLSYERRGYFEKNDGDFRVTFDKNITTRRGDVRLESGSYGQQLLPENTYLMEIKINRAVPLWFTRILSELEIYPVSFSKYGTEYKKYVMENQRMNGGETLCLNQYLQVQRRIQLALVQPC